MFTTSIIFLILAGIVFAALSFDEDFKPYRKITGVPLALSALAFLFSCFTTVPASSVAAVTTFGEISPKLLTEGPHLILPWSRTHDIYLGQQSMEAKGSEAGSKDLQSVHADLVVNFAVDPDNALSLFKINPTLTYAGLLLQPAMYETFKAVVAKYNAEELVAKRQDVSAEIVSNLQKSVAPYHLRIQRVNLVNFGFSKTFNAAIEEKVTANQKAATAENNLKRTKFEAEQRIAQAEGEAKAIAIQSAAIEKSGGAGYVQLQAIQKWDGKLPQYVTGGTAMPFVNVK